MLKRRLIVALLAAFILSLILSYISYTPIAKREPNSWYESFSSYVIVCLIFTLPAYLIAGIPISLYIDRIFDREIIKLPFYLFGGFMVGIATIALSFWTLSLELLWFGLVGLFASLLFYLLILLEKRFN